MSNVEKITIALTQEMAAQIRQAVADGSYASASEVIREAMRDWETKRALRGQQIEEIRRLWREGLESGIAGELDMDEIKKEARRRFIAMKDQPEDHQA